MLKGLFFILLIFNFACSSSQTKKQCQDLDWLKVGLGQAFEGMSYDEGYSYYYTSCSLKHHVQINKREFQKGYQYGLSQFCDQSNAAIWGLQGKKYNGICPKRKEKRFLASYSKGYNQYLSHRVESLNGTVSSLEQEIKKLKKEIAHRDSKINSLVTHKNLNNTNR
ncbi:MAG: hypothetical protein A2381_02150 [Bdellovibrionales bacterium RIFOXYB1_FULL_37_110]|nr:MAG: hypothetical protein A2417_13455 [Bdellovibrionales bacterium RIFOXYC1_FULL_37_79]OFZ59242.1 MAG: hypothetical protein A2381_02150 [Bdellovibrionales bacterium RIFOXYB1_FULL_37_110]OFZ62868.1 MAG: hypothetical protein A2577_11105 [Bdellovibrionales bacterium RIFOXYD1_FULL_36_51]